MNSEPKKKETINFFGLGKYTSPLAEYFDADILAYVNPTRYQKIIDLWDQLEEKVMDKFVIYDYNPKEIPKEWKKGKSPDGRKVAYPPNAVFSKNFKLTKREDDLNSKIKVISLTVKGINEYINKIMCINSNDTVITISKGMYKGKTPSQTINAAFPELEKICAIAGPTFAIDLVNRALMGLTIASEKRDVREKVAQLLQSNNLLLETIKDINGMELLGAAKNVYALLAGILSIIEPYPGTHAILMTQAIKEMRNMLQLIGADESTIYTWAGIGDMFMTGSSGESRNCKGGKNIGEDIMQKSTPVSFLKGIIDRFPFERSILTPSQIKQIMDKGGETVEGYSTLEYLHSFFLKKCNGKKNELNEKLPMFSRFYDFMLQDITNFSEIEIRQLTSSLFPNNFYSKP